MKRYTENLYLLFDSDDAGNQATLRALKLFYQQNLFPKIIQLPTGFKDVDELANIPDGKSVFETCLHNAQDGFVSVYYRLREKSDLTSPVDKQKLINTMFELILSVNSLTIQEHYKQLLAEKLGFAVEILDAQFKKFKTGEGKLILQQQARQIEQENTSSYQVERDLLYAALFYQDSILKYLSGSEKLEDLIRFVSLLAEAQPESLLHKVLKADLEEEIAKKLLEFTLWRDGELEALQDIDKKYQLIMQRLTPYLQSQLQRALKNPNLSVEAKQALLLARKQL